MVVTTYARFWALVDRTGGPESCWPWTGPVTAAGAGVFRLRGRRTTARRYAYRAEYGDPGPLRVVVTCALSRCVNPRHLTVRTAAEIAVGNGSAAAVNAARSCAHPRTAETMYVHPGDGRRECAVCKAERVRGQRGPPVGAR